MGAPETTAKFPWVGLLVLFALVFITVTSEFLPVGLLPDMAADLDVPESQIGLLLAIFAGTVVLTTAPLTVFTRRFPRKSLLIVVLLVFVLANVLAAIAPNYPVLAVARVIGGLAHGMFWAVVGAYSTHLVPKHQIGRAVAITTGGGAAAFVLGIPLGTAVGNAVGWRMAFVAIAVIVLVLIVLAARFLPPVQHLEQLATGEIPLPLRKDKSIPGIVIICVIVILVITGHNIFATYVVPYLVGPVGIPAPNIPGLLFASGIAGVIGLVAAGFITDRLPRSGFIVKMVFVVASVLMLGLLPSNPWIAIPAYIIWGAAFGGAPAILHAQAMRTASLRMRDNTAAYITTSFNIGIGGGALIGGLLLDQLGVLVLPFAYIALALVGMAVAVAGDSWLRRRAVATAS